MYIMNKIGPWTDPYGSPNLMGSGPYTTTPTLVE